MHTSWRFCLAAALFTVAFAGGVCLQARAAEYRHQENSLNHLGITPQSVSHNNSLIRRAQIRDTRSINRVNDAEVYRGGLYCEPRYEVQDY